MTGSELFGFVILPALLTAAVWAHAVVRNPPRSGAVRDVLSALNLLRK
ncbi:hypothetical protein LPC08_01780 [Roseomonas sp. OT10]|nr:hypothetical protein [Roseomonas sp. OT10]UFN49401.1 hypothetical protein LPC08_01780 [Roseomonas sp. OT10]